MPAVVGGERDGLALLEVGEGVEQRGAPPVEVESLEREGLELRRHLIRGRGWWLGVGGRGRARVRVRVSG